MASPDIKPARNSEVLVILNSGSGEQRQSGAADVLRSLAERLGYPCDIVLTRGAEIRAEAGAARDAGYRTVIVGGGDGSINAVASELAGSGVTLGVLPLGTFNYFARELGIPQELESSFELCATADCSELTVGEVNGHLFLNNASIGLYPQVLTIREETYRRFGRSRLAAYWSVLIALVKLRVNKRLRLTIDGETHAVRTPMVFVARNAHQLEEFELAGPACIQNDGLAVYVLPPTGRLGLLKLAWRVFRRRVQPFVDVQVFCARSLIIEANRHRANVAVDGERIVMTYPLRFTARPNALKVITPRSGDVAA